MRDRNRSLAAVVVLFGTAYALIGLFKHWHFDSSAFDLGIFDQAVWQLSRFRAPISSYKLDTHLWGDHFHPILATLSPLYWVWPAPETLLVAQSALVALSIVPVYTFSRRRLSAGLSLTLGVVYGFFWGLQRLVWFDFHELAFAPLLVAVALDATDRRRWPAVWAAAIGLMLCKEDLIPFVIGLGVFVWLFIDKRNGWRLFVTGCLAFLAVMFLILPYFSPSGGWMYESSFVTLLSRPWLAPALLVYPSQKLVTLAVCLVPFLFLPLASRWTLLALAPVCTRMLSDAPSHWSYGFHYWAPVAPILAMGTADSLGRFLSAHPAPARRRIVIGLLTFMVAISATVPGHQPILRIFSWKHYRQDVDPAVAARALAVIPANASVVAQSGIAPHLSHRDRIYMLTPDSPDASYVIASTDVGPWPFAHVDDLKARLAAFRLKGYEEVFSEQGWVVLRR